MASPTSAGSSVPKQDNGGIDEAMLDKFATLFSPATPRASPTMEPVPATTIYARPVPRPGISRKEASGSDSDFGSFVTVSAMEDPLAMLDFDLPPAVTIGEPPKGSGAQTSSLDFFDKFAQDAKTAADRKKHGVLDELLMHEDDPLYWLKEQDKGSGTGSNTTIWPRTQPKIFESPSEHHPVSDPASPLQDLDHDFFTTKPVASTLNQSRAHITTRPEHSPTRSSTLALSATLAPPVADTSTASSSSSTPLHESFDPLSTSTHSKPSSPSHSSSYSTLSSLSSRWMSSLLPSSKSNPNYTKTQTTTPSLESLFAIDTGHARTPLRKSRSRSIDRRSRPEQLYRATSHPAPSPTSVPDVQISHGTPFARPAKASPFASHIYVPPTGAPGYKGEQYDWDKGFSAELERELSGGNDPKRLDDGGEGEGDGEQAQELSSMEDLAAHARAKARARDSLDVGYIMEKKSGGVELIGRNTLTTPVLSADLADEIRPHLPALARLPRKWTLIYSLDQHGISLNTLYTRCEGHMQVKPGTSAPAGALVVVKDAGDGIFGAWTGKEGVHPSRGQGYYGSGDSFLWKYIEAQLQVFKWTGKNDYIALCEPEFISFGGGDGNYGLYLDDTLYKGSSAPCPTFANEPLCSPGPKTAGLIAFELEHHDYDKRPWYY
ncbi:hypothetical protein D9615_007099 [Tricholomella constricta]|uniref:Oxidation resistance protein 1 n=1 Tax=Tricholomella constricta TaxID=117010 RepID=A0A8H5M2P2_9AGAR|nr:hypothetical protein D9615_007099 [Tricholomella constricta]